MAVGTKDALASALRQMMRVKPIDKITVKDIVEICGVNRQTFYYHFDDVDDLLEWVFEDDAERVLPKEVVYERWMEDVMTFMDYLESNSLFTLNVYNSNSRLYMLRYLKSKLKACIEGFATCAIGFISQWLDSGMQLPRELTRERILKVMDQSVENIIARFTEPSRRF